jgi:hypothetical protein
MAEKTETNHRRLPGDRKPCIVRCRFLLGSNAMSLKKILVFTAVFGTFSLAATHNPAQAVSLINPSAVTAEKTMTQVQWRHRHHQLRRQSRRHPHYDDRPAASASSDYAIRQPNGADSLRRSDSIRNS